MNLVRRINDKAHQKYLWNTEQIKTVAFSIGIFFFQILVCYFDYKQFLRIVAGASILGASALRNQAPIDPCRPQNRGSNDYLRAHKGSRCVTRPLIQDSSVSVLFPRYKGNLT